MEELPPFRFFLRAPGGSRGIAVDFERVPRSRFEIYAAVRAAYEEQVVPLGETQLLQVVIEGSALFSREEAEAADRGVREGSGASRLPPFDEEEEAARAKDRFSRFILATVVHFVVRDRAKLGAGPA
jgi:hypothetical protein